MKIQQNGGFTLIELLVSVTIIFLLMLATIPGYDSIRSRNILRTNADIIRDCVSKAKALALSPDIDAQDIEYYQAVIGSDSNSNTNRQNKCIIELKRNSFPTVDFPPVQTVSLNPLVKIITNNNAGGSISETYYIFKPTKNGVAEVTDITGGAGITDFFLEDDSARCLTMRFVKEAGELFVDKLSQINFNPPPPTCP